MSFSAEQKAEIAAQPIKALCCKKAFLCGILTARATLSEEHISVSVSTRDVAQRVVEAVREVYSKDALISTMPGGGRGYCVRFSSPAAQRFLSGFLSGDAFFDLKCRLCQSHFLRGLFLAAGRVTDPTKQYILEFSVKNCVDRFAELFTELDILPRISKKPKETVIYFKNSAYIEDFFGLAGMNNTAFALMNAKIQGEIRNNVNRVANCETNNINKAVSASAGQIALIAELASNGLISQLPDELQKTALLRLQHSDLSLSQLAALITPYISKPGLSHRLKRISELGEELLNRRRKHNK